VASLLEAHGQAGDEGYFEALYQTYKSEVQRLASYLLRNTGDAEDASQTVFLNVLRALRQGVRPTDPRAWLLAITRNVCFSRHRAVACRPDEVELDPETVGDSGDGSGPSADDIVGALTRLLPNQRTALILRDFRGVPRAEISELLALSPTGVEALLTRARASFREELEADAQPLDCAETKALVEQQLEGLITVAERHSLRAHLRHCSPCSTLARAVRSSRGKLVGLLVWPADLISRIASAFSQAPAAVHVAGAVSSAAVVAGVAIPVAIHYTPGTAHVQRHSAPKPAAIAHPTSSSVTQLLATSPLRSQASLRTALAQEPAAHARAHARARSKMHARIKVHARIKMPAHAHAVRKAPVTAAAAPTSNATSAQPSTEAAPVLISSRQGWKPPENGGHVRAHAGTVPDSMSPAATPPPPKPKPGALDSPGAGSAGSSSTPAAVPAANGQATNADPGTSGKGNNNKANSGKGSSNKDSSNTTSQASNSGASTDATGSKANSSKGSSNKANSSNQASGNSNDKQGNGTTNGGNGSNGKGHGQQK
jgi:RNA polymerase sigma factor (sigma-70 family)